MVEEEYLVTSKVDQLRLKWLRDQKKSNLVWMDGQKIAVIQGNGAEFNLVFEDADGYNQRLTIQSYDILIFSKISNKWIKMRRINQNANGRFINSVRFDRKYFLLWLKAELIKSVEPHEKTAFEYGLL